MESLELSPELPYIKTESLVIALLDKEVKH